MTIIGAIPYQPIFLRRNHVSAHPSDTIEALIQRAKSGDSNAVTRLYEMYIDQIYRYVAYRVPESEAEDITSDVFINMVEGLPNYTFTGAPFESWLYRIASARVADYYRKTKQREFVELPETLKSSNPAPEETMIVDQEQAKIREKLQHLSEEQQTILIMRFVERKSHEEVAEMLNKTVTAVKTTQHRALKRLAQLMGQAEKERHYLRGRDE